MEAAGLQVGLVHHGAAARRRASQHFKDLLKDCKVTPAQLYAIVESEVQSMEEFELDADTVNLENVVKKVFPGSMAAPEVVTTVSTYLASHGFNPENTLFAHSTCPDEINHEHGDITNLMHIAWGEMFIMGGLAGLPFVGKTGFNAFSHHVPDNGNIFILFAPHVSVSRSGEIGKYERPGQQEVSTACGAAIGAFKSLLNKPAPELCDSLDYQFHFIQQKLQEKMNKILDNKGDPMVELSYAMFDICKEYISEIVHMKFAHLEGQLAILGGIQINIPYKHIEDHFCPLYFSLEKKGENPTNIMHVFPETTRFGL